MQKGFETMITVYEFMTMFVEEDTQKFRLWDINKEEIIFVGTLNDLNENLYDVVVTSIDNLTENSNRITLNIEM